MFTVVGERINTSRHKVEEAVAARDTAYIQEDVKKQQAAGTHYIDVNAGAQLGHEMEDIKWLVQVIQEAVTIPLSLDSPDPKVLEMAYGLVEKPPMINSISLEKNRYDTILPFLKGKECSVLALCMEDTGMPKTAPKVVERAKRLVQGLEGVGIMREFIYVDPLVQPVSTDTSNAMMVMEAVRKIMTDLPGVHTICGLSNVSFGMPQRKALNRTFLSLMMAAGLDSAIVDPLDQRLMTVLRSTEVLLGQDDYCRRYLKAFRAGELQA